MDVHDFTLDVRVAAPHEDAEKVIKIRDEVVDMIGEFFAGQHMTIMIDEETVSTTKCAVPNGGGLLLLSKELIEKLDAAYTENLIGFNITGKIGRIKIVRNHIIEKFAEHYPELALRNNNNSN